MPAVARVFTSKISEPRYRASLRMFLSALRVRDRIIATASLIHGAMTGRPRMSAWGALSSTEIISAIVLPAISRHVDLDT